MIKKTNEVLKEEMILDMGFIYAHHAPDWIVELVRELVDYGWTKP